MENKMNTLPGGIPRESDYKSLLLSNEFERMENFSNNFIERNKSALRAYSKKWVGDPLHQWSRQWEYPYILNCLAPIFADKDSVRILDAGSGITFFPYYVNHVNPSADMYCIDYDATLEAIYHNVNTNEKDSRVSFYPASLTKIPYADNFFDALYCISVLEHTDAYAEILGEFHRVLRPGGKLALTFDISLDSAHDISVERAEFLISTLIETKFINNAPDQGDLAADVLESGIFTTLSAQKINPKLLPWKFPAFVYQLKSFIANQRFSAWPPPLTVYCSTWTKAQK